jgi:hypothetical protein
MNLIDQENKIIEINQIYNNMRRFELKDEIDDDKYNDFQNDLYKCKEDLENELLKYAEIIFNKAMSENKIKFTSHRATYFILMEDNKSTYDKNRKAIKYLNSQLPQVLQDINLKRHFDIFTNFNR